MKGKENKMGKERERRTGVEERGVSSNYILSSGGFEWQCPN